MISINKVSFGYDRRTILKGVAFGAESGQLVQLVGSNGSGKTTLIKIIAGLIQPSAGQVQLQEPIQRGDVEYLMSEENGLYQGLSAAQNLLFWTSLRGHSLSHERLKQELQFWGLKNRYIQESLPVGRFSTGMKRRLALTRLRLSGTRLWLLDEPVYGLDKGGIVKFKQTLTHHLQNDGAIIMITHDISALPREPDVIVNLDP